MALLENVFGLCKAAKALGKEEYHTHRVRREWQGQLPKRKGPTRKYIDRVVKKANYFTCTTGSLYECERRMVLAAYDCGLLEKHNELEVNSESI